MVFATTNIFKRAGFGSDARLFSLAVGLAKLLATLLSAWKVDLYGRRFLLLLGTTTMAISLVGLAGAFKFLQCNTPGVSIAHCAHSHVHIPAPWSYAIVASFLGYVCGFEVSFGSISWLVLAEVFPLSVRGSALSIALLLNFLVNIFMTLNQIVLQDRFGSSDIFSAYCAMCLVSIAFVWRAVPETKGNSLEEIEASLVKKPEAVGAQTPSIGNSFRAPRRVRRANIAVTLNSCDC